jgi:hypothetical protein
LRIARRNLVLAGLLAALLSLEALLARPARTLDDAGPLLAGFDAASVARIELRPADGLGLTLERAGDGWTVRERDGFPAYRYAVDELLADVRGLSALLPAGDAPSSHEALGVGQGGLHLILSGTRGRSELVQGAPQGLSGGSTVRLAGSDAVFRAPGFAPLSTAAGSWLDTRLLDFEPSAVRGLRVARAGENDLRLERSGQGWQNAAGAPAPKARVERLLELASTLVLADLVDAEVSATNGLGEPAELSLELVLEGGVEQVLCIGIQDPNDPAGAFLATRRDWSRDWCVALPAETAQVLFAAIDDLD